MVLPTPVGLISPSRSSSAGTSTHGANVGDPDAYSFLSDTTSITLDNDVGSILKGTNFSDTNSLASSSLYDLTYLQRKELPGIPNSWDDYGPETLRNRSRSRSPQPVRQLGRHRQSPHRQSPHRHSHESHRPTQTPVETPSAALIRVIGPDNVTHTTELDSIPCAGIRIPVESGKPFGGLLAWRLVVRRNPRGQAMLQRQHRTGKPEAPKRSNAVRSSAFLDAPPPTDARPDLSRHDRQGRGHGHRLSLALDFRGYEVGGDAHTHERSMSEVRSTFTGPYPSLGGARSGSASASALSLPLTIRPELASSYTNRNSMADMGRMSSSTGGIPSVADSRTPLIITPPSRVPTPLNRSAPSLTSSIPQHPPAVRSPLSVEPSDYYPDAVTTNFVFDTSISDSEVSRQTLEALGFSSQVLDALEARKGKAKTVQLYLQDIKNPITFRLARPGEPGRLGVQFLEEARVNVCLGEGGRGGIMWADDASSLSRHRFTNVPKTIPLPKLSLQARVKMLFGLSP